MIASRRKYRWMRMPAVAALLVSVCLVSCGYDDDPVTTEPPVFSATPVDIAFNPDDSTFGDIMFVWPVLTPFGVPIPPDSSRLSASFEYFTIPGAPVRAVTRGVVDTIIENPIEEGDYEIRVASLPGSDYTVVYDHVINLMVLQSSVVDPGDTIGRAGTWNDTMRRTELLVTLGEDADRRAYCPLNYGDSAFIERHMELLHEYNRRGFLPHYDTLCQQGSVGPLFQDSR